MKSNKKTVFSSQWRSDNVLIEASKGRLTNFFLDVFFKRWISLRLKKSEQKIVLNYSSKKRSDNIETPLFYYSREIFENQIITIIHKPKVLRALVRSLYKFVNKQVSVVGLPELYMAIIRKTIIEPIEYLNYLKGWKMIHASVFRFNDKLFIVSAGSRAGKSTLVSKLKKEYNCEVLSDNYCFVKGNSVRTIDEPLRGGSPSRYKLSLYKRTINGYPSSFEGEVDHFIIMNRGGNNQLSKLSLNYVNCIIDKINSQEKEGICFLEETDSLRVQKNEIKIDGNFGTYKLEVAEGLNNLNISINLIKNI